ncbi:MULTISPECIES: hypothetical protein [Vibrio]|uniref:hypothetical protein n=1 Tax=Vibrio TaxID=662 RepID=UPI00187EB171|nr:MULTISPECIES: hypothetical protein [Vibrio]EGX6965381.1 hypothetical protein [Vibrio alginolyticus]EJG0483209.1 hypothetical protein [Vibrio alginolyticus]EJT0555822.1 hypothetical protein [Vibrio vulnificus]EJX2557692.1 hypothetical protein [Vibrio alginolyticus]ELA9085470.1 hypothetical protein [Vibrio alginolyticus]
MKSAVISSWSVDAFLCLNQRLVDVMSSEYITRIENFIDAYVLYDKVYLPYRYKDKAELKALDSNSSIFEFVDPSTLEHSDDMKNHVSIDIGLYERSFDELCNEDKSWFVQHQPSFGEEAILHPELFSSGFMTQLRLWQWGLINEMGKNNAAIPLMPLSLEAIEVFDTSREKLTEIVINKYYQYAKAHEAKFIALMQYETEPFIAQLSKMPPLLSLFIDRTNQIECGLSTLITLRDEFVDFRKLRESYTASIQEATTFGERNDIVSDWNSKWDLLCKGEFKTPNLLRRKVSSTELSSAIVSPGTGGAKAFIHHVLEHFEYKKSYKQFRVFGTINQCLSNMDISQNKLNSVFGVERFIEYKKT